MVHVFLNKARHFLPEVLHWVGLLLDSHDHSFKLGFCWTFHIIFFLMTKSLDRLRIAAHVLQGTLQASESFAEMKFKTTVA